MRRGLLVASIHRLEGLLAILWFASASCSPLVQPVVTREPAARQAQQQARDDARVNEVDPAFFGAHPDDVLDDTVGLQRAIDMAGPGARLRLARGTYYVSDTAPFDQVALRLAGMSDLEIAGEGAKQTHVVLRSARDSHVISISEARNISIRRLGIDGSRSQHQLGHAIRVAESQGVRLSELSIAQAAHYGIGLQGGSLRGITIEHVSIRDTGGDGIDFKNTKNDNDTIVIRDVEIVGPGQVARKQAGIDIRGPATLTDVTVSQLPVGGTGIRFREDGSATGLGGHRSKLSRFRIHGETESTGVQIAADDVTVDTGLVKGTEVGVVVLGTRATVRKVAVEMPIRHSFLIGLRASSASLLACSSTSGLVGLWLEGAHATVRGCSFTDNRRCGICVRSSAVGPRLEGNSFLNSVVEVQEVPRGLHSK